MFMLRAGTIHAIGAGLLILEVQQRVSTQAASESVAATKSHLKSSKASATA